MIPEAKARAVAYQVLDQILANKCVAPGAMFSAVDTLRRNAAPAEDVRRVESISIETEKLEWALQRRKEAESEAALDELKALAAEWLNVRICGPRRSPQSLPTT